MAWPLTPLTTYLPRGLPPIKASDLNAIQNAINRNFLGTYSQFGLVLDGIGGQDVAPAAGSLSASGDLSCRGATVTQALSVGADITGGGSLALATKRMGTTVPTPQVTKGTLYADACVVAMANIGGNGTLRVGFGIQAIKWYSPTGEYDITLQVSTTSYQTYIPVVCGGDSGIGNMASAAGINANTVRVKTYELSVSTSNLSPQDFNLIVFAL